MTLERVQKLEAAGFQWAKRKGAEAWEAKFEELVKYREEHGGKFSYLACLEVGRVWHLLSSSSIHSISSFWPT